MLHSLLSLDQRLFIIGLLFATQLCCLGDFLVQLLESLCQGLNFGIECVLLGLQAAKLNSEFRNILEPEVTVILCLSHLLVTETLLGRLGGGLLQQAFNQLLDEFFHFSERIRFDLHGERGESQASCAFRNFLQQLRGVLLASSGASRSLGLHQHLLGLCHQDVSILLQEGWSWHDFALPLALFQEHHRTLVDLLVKAGDLIL
mmetsp:Transcript_86372/g.171471  ORF Transcript_86372/g.171471 Transcript_86372/m.171471 type:complete len:203 (+) Transcript_86372:744-1352(+)